MGNGAKESVQGAFPPSLLDRSRARTKLTLSSSSTNDLEGVVLSEHVRQTPYFTYVRNLTKK